MQLQEIMDAKNLSQYKLAIISGVSQGCLSKLLTGKRSPTGKTLQKLAIALGVTVSEILGETPFDGKSGPSSAA